MMKSEKFKNKTARQIAIETIKEAIPRLQTHEEEEWTEGYIDFAEVEQIEVKRRWFSEVPGSRAPDHVMVGAIQAVQNKGYDVSEAEKLIVPAQIAYETNNAGDILRYSALIFKALGEAPKDESSSFWDYKYYESFDDYRADVDFEAPQTLELSDEEFHEKIHAGWEAQIAGGAIGTILEGYTTDNIRQTFGEVRDYLRHPSTHNDDVLFELAFIDTVNKQGRAVTADDIALEWIANIAYAWSAEEIAMKNLKRGIFPPESARLNNPWNEWIGAQMRGSICGLVAPGNPEEAARLAWMDGSISHVNNGIIGEVFNAILVAQAWTKPTVREVLASAIGMLPKASEYYSVIDFAYQQCLQADNWESAWRACEKEYERYNWIHAYPNAAAEVVALYFAEDDFDECMYIISMCGQDVDCNAGQIGTIYGVMFGREAIDRRWMEPFQGKFESLYRGYENTTIERLADETNSARKRLI